jgi:hypothetical protein
VLVKDIPTNASKRRTIIRIGCLPRQTKQFSAAPIYPKRNWLS